MINKIRFLILIQFILIGCKTNDSKFNPPNIIIIYTDDLGYGDVSAYGKGTLNTPNIDKLANEGIRFNNGYSTSATCSPSRYGLLTGNYPWRKNGLRVITGGSLVIDTTEMTIPKLLKTRGYHTAIVGKWHLGLGSGDGVAGSGIINYNLNISPGPNQVGFDFSHIMADTQDRVPTVYIENGKVINLDPGDPIEVNFFHQNKHDDYGLPTGLKNPEMTTMKWHHGHNGSIINGVPRIGYMKGGKNALWSDIDMSDHFLDKSIEYIKANKSRPFFLFYSLQQPHVPRTPHPRFEGQSGMGPRGDAIVEADWSIGELYRTLQNEDLLDNTLIIFSSDNGPVLNDGYYDDAVEKIGDHNPSGGLRGGKYSLFEAGTRVPFITYWKGKIKPQVSDEIVSQIDFLNSIASLIGSKIRSKDGKELDDLLFNNLGTGRKDLILEAQTKTALRSQNWILIPPYEGPKTNPNTNIESGRSKNYQLYNLNFDISQQNNLANSNSEKLKDMISRYQDIIGKQ